MNITPRGIIITNPYVATKKYRWSSRNTYDIKPTTKMARLTATKFELIFSCLLSINLPYGLNRRNKLLNGRITQVENAKMVSAIMIGNKNGSRAGFDSDNLFNALV